MATLAKRTSSPMAEMLDWLESNSPLNLHGVGLAPYVRVEDYLDEGAYVVRAELPGVDPDKDVEVSVENDMLTIRGERREETKEKNRREFHYGSFRRTLALPRARTPTRSRRRTPTACSRCASPSRPRRRRACGSRSNVPSKGACRARLSR